MNNTTTAQFGFKKSQLNKVNQKIYKNILSQKEEQKIKHLVGNKSHVNLPPKINKQLNPIQLKKKDVEITLLKGAIEHMKAEIEKLKAQLEKNK